MSLEWIFRLAIIAVLFATVHVLSRLLKDLGLGENIQTFFVLMALYNPFQFRFYLANPYMISDLVFQCGLLCAILAIKRENYLGTFFLILLAFLARQTLLITLPFLVILMWKEWKNISAKTKLPYISILLVFLALEYQMLGHVATLFASSANYNTRHVTALLEWMLSAFDPRMFILFVGRGLLPLIPALVLFFFCRKNYRKGLLYFFMAFFIFLQPLLGGPDLTGDNFTRLSALSNLIFIIAIAQMIPAQFVLSLRELGVAWLIFLTGSFHHLYSILPVSRPVFSVFYLFSCVALIICCAMKTRASPAVLPSKRAI